MDVMFNNNEISTLRSNDVKKQKKIIQVKLKQFDGSNIVDFLWRLIGIINNAEKKQEKKIFTVYKRPKDDIEDEKGNEPNNKKEETLSVLIDIKNDEMCKDGHSFFKSYVAATECIQCEKGADGKYCRDCFVYETTTLRKNENLSQDDENKIAQKYGCCKKCRVRNAVRIQNEFKMDEMKKKIIGKELGNKPSMELCLKTGLQKKPGLDQLVCDIKKLQIFKRKKYAVFQLDMDNLKALNTVYGHHGADVIISDVAKILIKYQNEVNEGKWRDTDSELYRCWVFKPGGDEFAMVCFCDEATSSVPFKDFYLAFKGEINGLIKKNKYQKVAALKEGDKTLKERKKKGIKTALGAAINKLDHGIWEKIENAIDSEEVALSLDKIGISTGLFIPFYDEVIDDKWMERADEALETAKIRHSPQKNEIAIYYESKGMVPANKIKECLEKGCGWSFW